MVGANPKPNSSTSHCSLVSVPVRSSTKGASVSEWSGGNTKLGPASAVSQKSGGWCWDGMGWLAWGSRVELVGGVRRR